MRAIRRIDVTLLVLVALCSAGIVILSHRPALGAAESGGGRVSQRDEDAIRTVVMGIESTWNSHDMDAMGELFWEEAEFINVVGMHWRGRGAIVAAHTAYHETLFKNHTIKTDSIEIRSIGVDSAIAVVTTTNDSFTTPGGEVIPKRQNRQTYVMTTRDGVWKIVHGHNVPVDAVAAQFDPVNART